VGYQLDHFALSTGALHTWATRFTRLNLPRTNFTGQTARPQVAPARTSSIDRNPRVLMLASTSAHAIQIDSVSCEHFVSSCNDASGSLSA
jgi:hypothetical protein